MAAFSPSRLRARRRALALSQEALAQRASVGIDVVRRAEQGRSIPSAEAVARIAHALDTSMESLFTDVAEAVA